MDQFDAVKDVTDQRLYFYPQEGVPDATPTVAVLDENGTTLAAAADTYVTLDGVSTTVGTASTAGDKTLTLAAVTDMQVWNPEVPGLGQYLVTNSKGQMERIRVRGVNSSTKVVDVDEPLEYAHDTSATVKGYVFYYTLQSTDVDALGEMFRARAVYAVDSLNYTSDLVFDVVKVPLPNLLTFGALKDRRPDLAQKESANTRGTDFGAFRQLAWEQVRKGIRRACLPPSGRGRPSLLRTPEDVEDWGWAEFDLIAHRNGVKALQGAWDPESAFRYLEEQIRIKREQSLATLTFYDQDEDDGRGEEDTRPAAMDFRR